jgi:hypothetical protein
MGKINTSARLRFPVVWPPVKWRWGAPGLLKWGYFMRKRMGTQRGYSRNMREISWASNGNIVSTSWKTMAIWWWYGDIPPMKAMKDWGICWAWQRKPLVHNRITKLVGKRFHWWKYWQNHGMLSS